MNGSLRRGRTALQRYVAAGLCGFVLCVFSGCGIREYIPFLPDTKYVDYGGGHKLTRAEAAYLRRIRDLHTALQINPRDAVAWLTLGELLREKGDYQGARQCYLKARRLDGNLAAVHFGMGVLALREERFTEALEDLRKARKLNPDDARIRRAIGVALRESNEPRKALTALDAALALDNEYTAAYLDKARVLYSLRRYRDAEKVCRKALAHIPKPVGPPKQESSGLLESFVPDSWLAIFGGEADELYTETRPETAKAEAAFDLALCLKAQGRLREALSALGVAEAAAPFDPAHTDVQLLKSRLQEALGNHQAATATLKLLQGERPNLPELPKRLARIYEKQGLHNKAAAARMAAAHLDHADRELQEEAVQAARASGRIDLVVAGYERLIRIAPDDPRYRRALARACEKIGLPRRAAAAWRELLRLQPNDLYANRRLGFLYADQPGRQGSAVLQFKLVLKKRPDDAEVRLRLAELLIAAHNYQEAEKHVKLVVKQQPDNAKAHQYLGTFYGRARRRRAAAEEFRKAVKLNPKLAVAYLNLAKVLREQYRLEEAIAPLRKYLELKPEDDEARLLLARTLRDADDRQGAAEVYAELAERRPDNVLVRLRLADLQAALGKTRQAFGLVESVIEKYPASVPALRLAARLYAKGKRPLRELYCRKRLLKLLPNDLESLRRAALLCEELRDYRAALEYHCALGKTGNAEAWRRAARLQKKLGHLKDAVASCRAAVKADPNDVTARLLLAEYLRETARAEKASAVKKRAWRKEALRCYDEIIARQPKNTDACLNRAGLFSETQNLSRAQLQYEEIIGEYARTKKPTAKSRAAAVAAHVGLGIVLRKRRKFAAAEREYKRALKLAPDSVLANYNLGLLYDFYLKKRDEARRCYRRYLEGGGDYELLPSNSPARPPKPAAQTTPAGKKPSAAAPKA